MVEHDNSDLGGCWQRNVTSVVTRVEVGFRKQRLVPDVWSSIAVLCQKLRNDTVDIMLPLVQQLHSWFDAGGIVNYIKGEFLTEVIFQLR